MYLAITPITFPFYFLGSVVKHYRMLDNNFKNLDDKIIFKNYKNI